MSASVSIVVDTLDASAKTLRAPATTSSILAQQHAEDLARVLAMVDATDKRDADESYRLVLKCDECDGDSPAWAHRICWHCGRTGQYGELDLFPEEIAALDPSTLWRVLEVL